MAVSTSIFTTSGMTAVGISGPSEISRMMWVVTSIMVFAVSDWVTTFPLLILLL